ncbi:cyclin-like protein [Pisolithus croceorrhizus]|nr:cyclin-like protein [Pisolithus croceorrhizus]KAI6162312.1 cyclin-like protein [Pisolithus thermaeus]
MKDISISSYRSSRNVAYPKKRPSPHGISKSHKTPLLGPPPTCRMSSYSAKSVFLQQRQREAQITALRRQGVLLEEEYREDIRLYMHEMERYTMSSSQSMDQQPEIRWHMRPCLVDFLVEIHFAFRLRPETLYLTLNIVDRYVSRRIVYTKHYQLVGCAALWIAAKFEDAKERVPTVQELAQICRETYDESAFIQMEGHVLATIQWTLGHPTAEAWLRLMCCDPFVEEDKVQNVARFLMEITLFYREFVKYIPSSIALGALTLARFLCGKPRRMFEETIECREIVELLDNRLAKRVNDLSETLVKKYSYAFYSKAATLVLQYYLHGGRFSWHHIVPFPATPTRSSPSGTSTPMSDTSDDFPLTPTSPVLFSSDPFSSSLSSDDDKENLPSAFEPVINKLRMEDPPDHYLPHEYLTLSRPALHNLNGSPRVTAVS